MLLLDTFPTEAIPPEGCVLVLRPADPAEVRNAVRSRECQSAVPSPEDAQRLGELLDTGIHHATVDVPMLEPGHCHYLALAGSLLHLSTRAL